MKQKRMKTVIVSCATALLAAVVASGTLLRGMHLLAGNDPKGIFHYALSEGKGLTAILFLILAGIILAAVLRNDPRNYVVQKDERGVNWLANGTFGTSRWMSEQEAEQVFRVEDIRKTTDFTTIYGQLSEHGEKTVSYRRSNYADELQNVFIVGSPGSGKSRCYVRTELINSILRGDSFIATDPAGELYATLAEWCRSRGIDVKVLNLKDFEHSDCWDCLAETVDPETGRMDGQSMMEFVTTYVCNMTSDGQKMDDFWYTMTILYLEQACALAAWNHETRVISDLSMLYRKTAESLPEYSENAQLFENTAPSIRALQKIILDAAKRTGYSESEIRALFEEIDASAPPFHIAEVHRLLLHYDEIEKAYHPLSGKSAIPSNNMGMIAYLSAHQESAEQKGKSPILTSAITGTLGKLTLLTDQRLSYILSEKGIRLSEVNQHPCAYFLIPSEDTPDLRSITGLFFSFLLKKAQANYDRAENDAFAHGTKNPILDLTVMLDEFNTLGVIGSSPSVFATFMANSRKRHLHTCIIVQNMTQVPALYGKENAVTITQSCIDVTILLASNDPETSENISAMTGVGTVQNESHNSAAGFMDAVQGQDYRSGQTGRFVMTPDEVSRFKKERGVLVMKAGERPLKLKRFDYTEHPFYAEVTARKAALEDLEPLSARRMRQKPRPEWPEILEKIDTLIPAENPCTFPKAEDAEKNRSEEPVEDTLLEEADLLEGSGADSKETGEAEGSWAVNPEVLKEEAVQKTEAEGIRTSPKAGVGSRRRRQADRQAERRQPRIRSRSSSRLYE